MFVKDRKKIVDVLLDQRKISQEVASSWKDLSNTDVENKLKSEHMVSTEDIARAYSALYDLPYVDLANLKIDKNVLELIPESLAREYKIIAYEVEKKDAEGKSPEKIRIAVAEPSKLATNLPEVISSLEKQKGFKIELAITSIDEYSTAVSGYKTVSLQSADAPKPVAGPPALFKTIDLDKITIPYEVITKFPEDIAEKYQMVVFEAPHSSFIKVAAADPENKKNREILDFVKEKNDIVIEEYKVPADQIQRAMRFYEKPKPKPIAPPPSTVPPTPSQVVKEPPREEKIPEVKVPEEKLEEMEKIPVAEKPPENDKLSKDEVPVIAAKKEEPLVIKGQARPQPTVLPSENDLDKFLGKEVKDIQELSEIAETGHVPHTVAAIIILAVLKKASDVHIEAEEKDVKVRYRVDGLLRDIIRLPLEMQPAIVSRVKILSKLKIDESRIPQDGRFDVTAAHHMIDLRISTLPTVHGEKIVMRILDKSAHLYTLEELGMTGRSLKVLLENMNKPYGVILSTGPTGSGKTTTLYAILTRISNASVNIVTLEDPVEYEMPGINQCQIKPKIGFTFANGLRSILRQDPNIIMVGEIRDGETAALATHAALTGHLVLSTLHTNDAAGALPRLSDMGVEPFFVTSLMNAIIGQRLVRKLCPKCKRPAHIPAPILKSIEEELQKLNLPKPYQFFEGAGCSECELGYKGRIGIFEVLTMNPQLENLVLNHKPSSEIKAEAVRAGMVTMKQDGLMKAVKGLTTVSEVLRVITV